MTIVTVELRPWLAKEKNCPSLIKGTIEKETSRAILLEGSGIVRAGTHCLRCGKELTHSFSQLIGYGPECSSKLGIPYPQNLSAEDEEEVRKIRERMELIKFKGWLPKSHIYIDAEAEDKKIAEEQKKKEEKKKTPPQIGIDKKGKIFIKADYTDKDKCKSIPGAKWDPGSKKWVYPLAVDTVERIKEVWEAVEMEKSIVEWVEIESFKRKEILEIKEEVKEIELKTKLKDILFPYQRAGVGFLTQAKRCILGDDMGTGKTLQSIAACDEIQAEKVLIVCPASLKGVWAREIEKWLGEQQEEEVSIIQGTKEQRLQKLCMDARFYIINYESARLHEKELAREWDVLILDESHRVKNRTAQQTKVVQKVAKKAERVFLLTGTPIMNRPDEIWTSLNIINPTVFSSFWKFAKQFCSIDDTPWGKKVEGVKNPEEFRQLLSPYMIRRKKEEVLKEIPSKTYQEIFISLEGKQKTMYKEMKKEMLTMVGNEEISASVIIAQITRLRQIATIPQSLGYEGKNPKLDVLVDIVEGTEEKIVVFSQFASAIREAKKVLDNLGIDSVTLTGETKQEERIKAVERFQNESSCKVFLSTIQAGGVGITLTAGAIAIFLDKHWTPALNAQAVDRIHRIGQDKPVTVYSVIAGGTIEEKIESMLRSKQRTFDELINEKVDLSQLLKGIL